MTICERMFEAIETRSDKSAAALSKILGVSTGQTSTWKARNTDPPAKYLAQICEYLDISLDYLVTGEEKTIHPGDLSETETWFIKKLRELDDDGAVAVRGAMLNEWRRVESKKGTGTAEVG